MGDRSAGCCVPVAVAECLFRQILSFSSSASRDSNNMVCNWGISPSRQDCVAMMPAILFSRDVNASYRTTQLSLGPPGVFSVGEGGGGG